MSVKAVEAVFFWRYNVTAFRAVYRRFPGNDYSKDFLQSRSDQYSVIDSVLHRNNEPSINVEYRWPGNVSQGTWRLSASDSRGQLAWFAAQPPVPWKIGDPANNPLVSIPGDPVLTTAEAADAEFDRITATGINPWLLAIKLRGEDRTLHLRAYLANPPEGLERTALAQLPLPVRNSIQALPNSAGGGSILFDDGIPLRAASSVERVLGTLARDPNVLLIGPPGTGKTVLLEDLRTVFEGTVAAVTFDPDLQGGVWHQNFRFPADTETRATSLVFHPSYGYENFVAGLVPSAGDSGLRLVARPGPLLSSAHWAGSDQRKALLILDEFNRGPAAAIFGDTLALLDRDKRHAPSEGRTGASIQRPYSHEEMRVDTSFVRRDGSDVVDQNFRLPASVYIVAAMNSTDRSVAPLDAALRRRFAIVEMGPDYDVLAAHFGVSGLEFSGVPPDPAQWTPIHIKQFAVELLRVLNSRIQLLLGQDFLLGHALLWPVTGDTADAVATSLSQAFDERIAATLRLTFLDQDESLAAVLKSGGQPVAGTPAPASFATGVATWRVPPPELLAIASPRLEVLNVTARAPQEALQALHAIL